MKKLNKTRCFVESRRFDAKVEAYQSKIFYCEYGRKLVHAQRAVNVKIEELLRSSGGDGSSQLHEVRDFTDMSVKLVYIRPFLGRAAGLHIAVNFIQRPAVDSNFGTITLEDFVLARDRANSELSGSKREIVEYDPDEPQLVDHELPHRILLNSMYGPTSAVISPGPGYVLPELQSPYLQDNRGRKMLKQLGVINPYATRAANTSDVETIFQALERSERLGSALYGLSDETRLNIPVEESSLPN